jgi:hypothetical protein
MDSPECGEHLLRRTSSGIGRRHSIFHSRAVHGGFLSDPLFSSLQSSVRTLWGMLSEKFRKFRSPSVIRRKVKSIFSSENEAWPKKLEEICKKVLLPPAIPIWLSSAPKRGRWCRVRLQFGSGADLSVAGMGELVSGVIRRSDSFGSKSRKMDSG